jgi:hypothetical protein
MHRFTFHFSLYGQGFSETLFRNTNFGPLEGYLLDNYIQKRLNLACTDMALLSVRSSDTNATRDITVYLDPTSPKSGTWAYGGDGTSANPGEGTNAEESFTALGLRLTDGGANYRSWAMIGMPDYVYQAAQVKPGEKAILTGRLNAWVAAMSAASFGMKAQGAPTATGRIVEFAPKEEGNQLVCLGLKGPIPAEGTLVTLGSVKPFSKLNRTWRVASTGPAAPGVDGYIYLAGTSDLNTYGAVEGGKYKQSTYSVAPLSQYTISRITSRKSGVPFGTVRGRR